jgi:hypothetical protein
MKFANTIGFGLLVGTVALAGCAAEKKAAPTPPKGANSAKDASPKKHDHDHDDADHHTHGNGPNGGVTFDMGKYHAEFTVDHPKKEVTVLFLKDEEGKKESEWAPLPVAATEFTLSIKETKVKEGADKGKVVAPMTITLKPADEKDGKASKFVGADPGIGNVADFEGTVVGEIDGKPSQGEFKE